MRDPPTYPQFSTLEKNLAGCIPPILHFRTGETSHDKPAQVRAARLSHACRETLQLPAGKKSLGLAAQVFKSNVRSVKYFKYESDRQLLGFSVSGSADGLQLDGLAAMPQFSRYLERQQQAKTKTAHG